MLLAACNSEFDKAPELKFNDVILRHNYTEKYGTATGLLNVYVMYGKYKLSDKEVPAGIALTPQGFMRFKIIDVLNKYPQLQSTESIEAAKRQELKPIEVK